MVTSVKGERQGKQATVDRALEQAFTNRVSRCFDSLCINIEEESATRVFVDRFKRATDAWNAATAAIQQEYPKGLVATPVED